MNSPYREAPLKAERYVVDITERHVVDITDCTPYKECTLYKSLLQSGNFEVIPFGKNSLDDVFEKLRCIAVKELLPRSFNVLLVDLSGIGDDHDPSWPDIVARYVGPHRRTPTFEETVAFAAAWTRQPSDETPVRLRGPTTVRRRATLLVGWHRFDQNENPSAIATFSDGENRSLILIENP